MQPAVLDRRRGVRRPSPVAVHHQVAAHQDLAVFGNAQIDPLQRPADRFDPHRIGRIGADHRAGLSLPVALDDLDAEGEVELAHFRVQPGTARHRAEQPPAEPAANLGPHQPVQHRVEQPVGQRQPVAGETASADRQRALEQRLLPGRLASRLRQNARADDFQNARHGGQDGRPHRQHVGGQVLDATGIDDFGPDARQEEHADGVLVAVGGRQIGQINLIFRPHGHPDRLQQQIGAPAVGQDGAMRQHHTLGSAAGARGVEQARERRARDRLGHLRDVIRRRPAGHQIRPPHEPGIRPVGLCRPIHDHQQVEPAGLPACLPHAPGERGGGHDGRAGARIAQDMRMVLGRVGAVGRHRHGADRHQRGLGDRIFRPVLGADQHTVAGRDPGGKQFAGAGSRHSGEVCPRDLLPGATAEHAQHRPVRPPAGRSEHHRRQVWPARVGFHASSVIPDANAHSAGNHIGRATACTGRSPLTTVATTLHEQTTQHPEDHPP